MVTGKARSVAARSAGREGTRRSEEMVTSPVAAVDAALATGDLPAAQVRDLYLSALARASRAGSLDGVLRLATAFAELGDDEVLTHSLRIARRLAGTNAQPELREGLDTLQTRASAPTG
jgi:hypothetical protein